MKTPPLPFDQFLLEVLLAAAVSHIFAENHNAFVAAHLVAQRGGDQIGHGFGRRLFAVGSCGLRVGLRGLGFEGRRRGIKVRRIHVLQNFVGRRRRRLQRAVNRDLQIVVHLLFQTVDALLVQNAFADEEHLHARDGIALGIALALDIRPVESLIVRKRVRVGPDHMGMDKSRTMPGAAMRHRAHEGGIAGHRVRSIYFFKVEVGEAADQAGNVSARGLHLDRHRDGISVVFDHENHGEPGSWKRCSRPPRTRLRWWCLRPEKRR